MVKKLSKKKVDVSFIDPKTMEVRCTFNQCVDKFTIKGTENTTIKGKLFVSAYHECNECGQRVKASGDRKRAYAEWQRQKDLADNEFEGEE